MNIYHYPLIIGGTLLSLLAVPPVGATVAEDSTNFQELASDLEFTDISSQDLQALELEPLNFGLSELEQSPPPFLAQTPLVPQPEIIIENQPNSNLQPNATTPTVPVLPRAVAPPVGDIAISNIDASSETVDLSTRAVIPRLVLREAPVREVLSVLARYAGFNVVFLDSSGQPQGQQAKTPTTQQTVSLEIENETVQDVFNSVLLVSGFKANRRGRTIFVGALLPSGARNLISRSLRLNQVNATSAATFLAAQGAEYQRLVTQQEDIVDPLTNRVVGRRETPPELQPLKVSKAAGTLAPFLLEGLSISVDDRLNAITLIGEPRQVQIATSMITQLDARRRQAVVNVKVIDVNLTGDENFSSSFSFGFNDGFFVQDNGSAVLNFGRYNPPTADQTSSGVVVPSVIPITGDGGVFPITPTTFLDIQNGPFSDISRGREQFQNTITPYARPSFGTDNNPFQPGLATVTQAAGAIAYTYTPPNLFQYPDKFLLTLQSSIQSGNAKILTDPSLVVQEGQQATVKLTEKVLESVNTQVDPLSGVRTTTPGGCGSGVERGRN